MEKNKWNSVGSWIESILKRRNQVSNNSNNKTVLKAQSCYLYSPVQPKSTTFSSVLENCLAQLLSRDTHFLLLPYPTHASSLPI